MRCRRSYSIAYAKVPHDAKNTRLRNGKEYIYSSLRFLMHKQHSQTAYRKYAVLIGTVFKNCDNKKYPP